MQKERGDIMKLNTKLVSSLIKVFPDSVNGDSISYATALQNEPFSFQVAYKSEEDDVEVRPLYVRIESDLDDSLITQYKVANVPVIRADHKCADDNFERKTPGIYPDVLLKRQTNPEIVKNGPNWSPWVEKDEEQKLRTVRDAFQTLWFTVNENGEEIKPGKYDIKIKFFTSISNSFVGEETLRLEIIDAKLPKQSLIYTSWFHCDSLADTYGVEVFSDRFFEIMRSFVSEATKTGMNMILLPAFTPPLDTGIGNERKTVQLVSVDVKDGKYSFDFSLMKKYIELCQDCGMENFEHNHFFTQWGAKHAPKIMATVDGEYKRIFGWDTDSISEEYATFLKAYLQEFKKFLKQMNLEKNIMFHISDEPDADCISYYENAQKVVGEEIKDYMCGDALSHYEYYERGCTKKPIVIVDSEEMDKFVNNCEDYWVYYTGNQLKCGSSNRIIQTPSARNRVIGLQMYVGAAKGFLHWGYNYYYDIISQGMFNPMLNPCGYNQLAGASYVVYPDIRGFAVPSLRMKVFYEGINDYRALQVLESLIGRNETLKFIEKIVGKVDYKYCPTNKELFEFRQKLNQKILEYI